MDDVIHPGGGAEVVLASHSYTYRKELANKNIPSASWQWAYAPLPSWSQKSLPGHHYKKRECQKTTPGALSGVWLKLRVLFKWTIRSASAGNASHGLLDCRKWLFITYNMVRNYDRATNRNDWGLCTSIGWIGKLNAELYRTLPIL